MRRHDLRTVQGASATITELGRELDRQFESERRSAERIRLLRETTNQITRVANDAVHAYRRATRAVTAELAKPGGDAAAANEMRTLLTEARRDVLRVLDAARQRYPWTDETVPPSVAGPGEATNPTA
jgi:histone H3/H4